MKTTIISLLERAEKANKKYSELENEEYETGRKEGASNAQIEHFQKVTKNKLPASLIEFYKITNGYDDLSMLTEIFDIDSIVNAEESYFFDDYEENLDAFGEDEWSETIKKEDLEGLEEKDILVFARYDQNEIFINFKKPTGNGEYQIVSFSYKYVEAWNSFSEYLISCAKSNESMVTWLQNKIKALKKDLDPSLRKKKDKEVEKLFSKQFGKKSVPVKPVLSFKWNHKSTTIEVSSKLIGIEDKKEELVRVLFGLCFYMPYSPSANEIKTVYKIFRKHIPGTKHVHMRNTAQYTSQKKDTHANDWEFIDKILSIDGDKDNWGLRTVDYLKGKSIDKIEDCDNWFNFRASPDDSYGKIRPAFLAIHVKTTNDPKLLLSIAKEVIEVIPFISGHVGYDTFQSRINYKPTIDIEYEWAQRYAGIRIEEEDYLSGLWNKIWPANWLTILGNSILKAGKANKNDLVLKLKKEKDIKIHVGKNGTIIQAGVAPLLGDVYKGEWPAAYSKVQAIINPITIHPEKKDDITFGGKFDDENMSATWFNRLTSPENFYCFGEKTAIWLPVVLAKKGASEKEIMQAIEDLKKYDGKSETSGREISTAAYEFMQNFEKHADYAEKMYLQAINWPNAHTSCYMNILSIYLRKAKMKDALKLLPVCTKAADNFAKNGEKTAGGIYWNIACVKALTGKPNDALDYIKKSKDTGYEDFKKLHRDEDFKTLWNTKEFEELFK